MKKNLILFFALAFIVKSYVKAQEQVTITPAYDDPYRNVWNVGAFAGLDVQGKNSGGIFYGAAARFTLGKFATFSGNIGLDLTKQMKSGGLVSYDEEVYAKLPSYKNIELRGVFHFKDTEGENNHKISLGSGGGYDYSTNYTIKSRSVLGLTASLNLQTRVYTQNSFDSTDILNLKVQNSSNEIGYLEGAFVGQNNLVLGVGLHSGSYTYFKGRFSSVSTGSKTRRIKSMTNANIEFLFAPAIVVGNEAYFKNSTGIIETYDVGKVSKKNLGFRVSADVLKGKPGLYARMEFGKKPGIETKIEADRMKKLLVNGYFLIAFGFGF